MSDVKYLVEEFWFMDSAHNPKQDPVEEETVLQVERK